MTNLNTNRYEGIAVGGPMNGQIIKSELRSFTVLLPLDPHETTPVAHFAIPRYYFTD